MALFYKPWEGSGYPESRTLLLSESAYDWNENGKWKRPGPGHPKLSVEHAIDGKPTTGTLSKYMKSMNRVLCSAGDSPSTAWNRFAYSIYVPKSVGRGPSSRPGRKQWKEAQEQFWVLLDRLRPRRVIVTGLTAWEQMPDCEIYLGDTCQAYEREGGLIWCLAVPHPAARGGFRWEDMGRRIQAFCATQFPERIS